MQSRIRNLSTRYFSLYKYGVVVLCGIAIVFFVFAASRKFTEGPIEAVGSPALWISVIFLWYWIRIHRKVHRVAFDEDFLYVMRRDQDTVIPLENIKEVHIRSLAGFYQIDLYNPEDFGAQLYFKPSLLYPLNFKKKDALVNVLRKNIDDAKAKDPQSRENTLHNQSRLFN